MKSLKYILAGIFFGIVLTKSEVLSWYRIQEMFQFDSFYMYGIFMTAIPTAMLGIWLIKIMKLKSMENESITVIKKTWNKGIVFGSLIFGFGWALTGACPGPLFALIGAGYSVTLVTLLSAIIGTWVFGKLQKYLPQ